MSWLSGLLGGEKATNPYKPPNVDFLRESSPSVDYSFLKNPTSQSKGFQSYVGAVGNESPAQKAALDSTIAGIQRDTTQKFGTGISDYFGRGLIEPGMGASSDIASNGLAQIAASGARTAADARTTAELSRESNVNDAYKAAFGADVGNTGMYASGLQSNADREAQRRQALAQILSGQAASSAASYRPQTYGLAGAVPTAVAQGFGQALGAGLGK